MNYLDRYLNFFLAVSALSALAGIGLLATGAYYKYSGELSLAEVVGYSATVIDDKTYYRLAVETNGGKTLESGIYSTDMKYSIGTKVRVLLRPGGDFLIDPEDVFLTLGIILTIVGSGLSALAHLINRSNSGKKGKMSKAQGRFHTP